jgi:hypothetical protein
MEFHPGGCPSGQRERSVKPPAQPTEVRILPLPRTDRPSTGCSRFSARCVRETRPALPDAPFGWLSPQPGISKRTSKERRLLNADIESSHSVSFPEPEHLASLETRQVRVPPSGRTCDTRFRKPLRLRSGPGNCAFRTWTAVECRFPPETLSVRRRGTQCLACVVAQPLPSKVTVDRHWPTSSRGAIRPGAAQPQAVASTCRRSQTARGRARGHAPRTRRAPA